MSDTPAKQPGRLVPWRWPIDQDVLELSLSCVPDWVPSEYREFFDSYNSFDFEHGEWLYPEIPPGDPLSIKSILSSVREEAEAFGDDPDAWFPVAIVGDGEYVVYHRNDDGSVEFGRYHFWDRQYLDGPYPSMAEWMRTYGVEL